MRKVRRSRRFRLALAWRRAPRAAMSSPLVVVVAAVTALLTSFLATATPLHAQAAAGAALTERHGSVCEDQYGPVFTSPSVDPRDAQTVIDVVRDRASRHGFGAPVVSMFTPVGNAEFGGEKFDFRVGYRTGGTGDLELLRGNASPGLWMGTELADAEGIPLGTRGHEGLLPPTTGIYRDLHLPAPGPWCSVRDLSMPNRLVDTLTGPVLFATDRASFDTATRPFSELERLTVTFRTPPPSTLAEATDRLRRADALIADVEQTLRDDGHGALTHGSTPFARSVELAHQARANVGLSIAPLAVLAVLIGCTGAAVLGLQWYQRRHRQVRLHLTRGHRPAAVGGLALAELGAPILFGGALGVVAAWWALPAYGPAGPVDGGGIAVAAACGVAATVVSALSVGAVVTTRARREFRRPEPARGRAPSARGLLAYVPWELGTAAVALIGWLRLADYGGTSATGDPLPQVDPLALSYPVAVVLTVGIVTARLAVLALRLSHRVRWWSRPALQLALRRLAATPGPVVGVLVISVLAVGTLAVGSAVSTAQRSALADKTGMYVGAESAVDVQHAVAVGEVPVPDGVREGTTLVGRINSTGTDPRVAVVDPATFLGVAWTSGLDENHLRTLFTRMDAPVDGELPAIRVGGPSGPAPDVGDTPLRAIADVEAFPLLTDDPGYVVSRTALSGEQLEAVTRWTLLSTGPLDALVAPLRDAGLAHPNPETRDAVFDALPFRVVEWTFSFVTLLGVVLAVVAVMTVVVATETRRRQNALAASLLVRMGMRRSGLLRSHLAELGGVGGVAAFVGLVCGVTVAAIAVPRFDPVRWLSPVARLPNPAPLVVLTLVGTALVVTATAWFAVRSARAAVPAELLRV